MKEAMLYQKMPDNVVSCYLCAHRCLIREDSKGVCRVRENRAGTLFTLVYGPLIAQHIDPVEKKPLFHFYPGTTAYSIAAPGCNFRCRWCQNADISQMPREQDLVVGDEVAPLQVVAEAREAGCRSIAYTYTEPTIFFEYAYDTALGARQAGLANIFVTNGYMTAEMLDTIHPNLDAANVDLKSFRDATYRQYVGAKLQPVLDSLRKIKQQGIWLEVTTLIIPGVNDDPAELRDAAHFIAQELGVDTPWHLSRFYPAYQMVDVPPTPVTTLQETAEIGRQEGLRYIYLGNIGDSGTTFCYNCGRALIRRTGYTVITNDVAPGSRCPRCGAEVAGVGMVPAELTRRRPEVEPEQEVSR